MSPMPRTSFPRVFLRRRKPNPRPSPAQRRRKEEGMIRIVVLVLCALCVVVLGETDTVVNKNVERIIGGKPADWHKYPWLAKNVCKYEGTTEWVVCGCGSTLIHPFYAITAGHCLNGPYSYLVGLQFSDGDVIEVAKETRHPNQSRDSLNYKKYVRYCFRIYS